MISQFFNKYKWQDSYCNICGSRNAGIICNSCLDCLPKINEYICCTKCLARISPSEPTCKECQTQDFAFDKLYASYSYDYPLAQILHKVKYNRQLKYVELLTRLFYLSHIDSPTVDKIIIVPSHYSKYIRRGYNSSYEIARSFIQHNKYNIIDLEKTQKTPAQVELDYIQRRNLNPNSFSLNENIENLNIAIIDDVVTTGSTVNTIARLCKNAGANNVYVYCLMRDLIY